MPRGQMLVVEDNEKQRRLYADFLGCFGYDVSSAAGWEEAVALLTGDEDVRIRPILVILDIMLPEVDGIEICRRLRGTLDGKVPILFFTAFDGKPALILEALKAGGNDFVVKNGSLNRLLERITHWTKPSMREAAEAARERAIQVLETKAGTERAGPAAA